MHTTLAVLKIKPEKNSGLNGIWTHDLCDTGAELYQLSYQANWKLTTLWVPNIPVEGEEYKWTYESSCISTAENYMKIWLIPAVLPTTLSSCEIKAWKNSGLRGVWTHDLCDTGAVRYQLSYQANWELATLWVRNIHCTRRRWRIQMKIWEFIYLNCGEWHMYEDIL